MKSIYYVLRNKTRTRLFLFEHRWFIIIVILINHITLISCDWSESKDSSNFCDDYFIRSSEFICDYPYNDTTKWVLTSRIWGLLKYYHPNITAGKHDWDKVLLDRLEGINRASSAVMVNVELERMLDAAGNYNYKKNGDFNDSLKINVDLCWLDNSFLDDTLKDKLRRIASIPVEQPSFYSVSIEQVFIQNEETHDFKVTASLNSMKYRLLSLFRYWNVIYYFYPHKYLMNQSWDKILTESVFPFIEATDDHSYQVAFLKLAAALNDGHGYITLAGSCSTESRNIVETVDNKTVVRIDAGGLQKGDIIKHVGQRDIRYIRDSLSVLIPASTELNKEYKINCHVAEMISKPRTALTILRNRKMLNIYPTPFTFEENSSIPYKWLTDEIGYVDFSALNNATIDPMFCDFSDADHIIFDLRYGVDNSFDADLFARHLSKPDVPYHSFSIVFPDLIHPGAFCRRNVSIPNPDVSKYSRFEGGIIYLISESSQSALETIAWNGRTNFHAILIGRTTSGAMGRVTWIPLPGNNRTRAAFSGFAILSPDGSNLQRKGIYPDIEVYPTMESIEDGKDEILEAAIEFVNNH